VTVPIMKGRPFDLLVVHVCSPVGLLKLSASHVGVTLRYYELSYR
jgi:hypothetical protein